MPAKANKSTKGSMMQKASLTGKASASGIIRIAPAASVRSLGRRAGMSDIRGHTMSWLAGYIYVGNGTLGATNGVYFQDATKTYTMQQSSGSYGQNVPIAGADSLVGAAYIADVVKHYARMRIIRQKLILEPLQPSTQNSMVVLVAPQKGPTAVGDLTTGTGAAATYIDVISMTGVKQAASWESCEVDFTPYIGGGSGARQDEFDNNLGYNAGYNNPAYVYRGVIPTTFAVSGQSSTSGLQGTQTHAVFIEQVVDLIDYIGGMSATYPTLRPIAVRGDLDADCKHSDVKKSAFDAKSTQHCERKRCVADVENDLRVLSAEFKSSNEDLNACKQILKEALSSWDVKSNSPDVRRMIEKELAENTNTLRENTERLLKRKAQLIAERDTLFQTANPPKSHIAAATATSVLSGVDDDYITVPQSVSKPPLVRST